jgi:S1-C subfamily serine protease
VTALQQFSTDLADLVARVSPSVVGVEHGRGGGSGLIVASDGYVLTNRHVARAGPARSLRVVLLGGEPIRAEIVGTDARTDLAVVRVDERNLPALQLAETAQLRVGQIAVGIGNPLGFERSVSLGIVSALYRSLPTGRGEVLEGLVQTDAAVNPGNSGGPLLDAGGNVIGVTTAMLPYANNIGFAVPSRTASWVAAVLMQHGEVKRPLLGISARAEELAPATAQRHGQGRGVRVIDVGADTTAGDIGLKPGDVLLEANRSPLATLDDLSRAMVLQGGGEIRLTVLRGQKRLDLKVPPRKGALAAA